LSQGVDLFCLKKIFSIFLIVFAFFMSMESLCRKAKFAPTDSAQNKLTYVQDHDQCANDAKSCDEEKCLQCHVHNQLFFMTHFAYNATQGLIKEEQNYLYALKYSNLFPYTIDRPPQFLTSAT